MISINFKQLEKLAIDNSPALLTAVGVVGTISTAVLTHRAATKSEHNLRDHSKTYDKFRTDDQITKKERIKLTWKNYIPPVVVGSLTVTSIVGANQIGSKRAAAVAAAYTLSERTFSEYREKVAEKLGENKHRAVQDSIAQDRVRENPPSESNFVLVGSGEVLCCDLFSGRYLHSSVEELKRVQNEIGYQIIHGGYASLTDFYERIGLPRTDVSEELGWNQDKMLELEFSTVLAEDNRPCVAFRFQPHPMARFDKFHP